LTIGDPAISYFVELTMLENSFMIALHLDHPLPAQLAGKVRFEMQFLPSAYTGKSYIMDSKTGIITTIPSGISGVKNRLPTVMAEGSELILSPEDPLKKIEIRQEKGKMQLINGQLIKRGEWFKISSEIPGGVTRNALVWEVMISQQQNWEREPVILHSQVGYHPDQKKRVLLELPSFDRYTNKMDMYRLNPDGGFTKVFSDQPFYTGSFLRYYYYSFDFSGIREEGIYQIRYKDQASGLFRISKTVFMDEVWQPTLEIFFPLHMDHLKVVDRNMIRQDLSQTDNAPQAPPNMDYSGENGIDDTTRTALRPINRITGLIEGGWFNSSNDNEKTLSQTNAVYWLGLAYLEFEESLDMTTVNWKYRIVKLHESDSVPDLVQQVEHGARFLLSWYRAIGHAVPGYMAFNKQQYEQFENGVVRNDILVNGHIPEDHGNSLAIIKKYPAFDYSAIRSLAVSSIVLKRHNPELAEKCLETAIRVWDEEENGTKSINEGTDAESLQPERIIATAELFYITGDQKYQDKLNELLPVIEDYFLETVAAVSRIYDRMDSRFKELYFVMTDNFIKRDNQKSEKIPFKVPFGLKFQGISADILQYTAQLYFLHKIFPEMIDRESIFQMMQYIFGIHPCSAVSLVSGIGSNSMHSTLDKTFTGYSFIPGGVVPGPSLIKPDFPELKEDWPYLQQQSGYSIESAAMYIFCVLSMDDLLD
jgi:hypothetical protein